MLLSPTSFVLAYVVVYISASALLRVPSSIPKTNAIQIKPTLELTDGNGNILSVSMPEDADMASNLGLVGFLPSAKIACCSGIWRFFPNANFSITSGPGISIGLDDTRRCFDISSGSSLLAGMKSYRVLAPQMDLNQQAIVTYSEEFGGGVASNYTKDDFVDGDIIADITTVKSFLLTGEHDVEEGAPPDDDLAPVFKFFSGTDGSGSFLCFALSKPDTKRSKYYFHDKMELPDSTPIPLGSMFYLPLSALTAVPFICPKTPTNTLYEVPFDSARGVASFREVFM